MLAGCGSDCYFGLRYGADSGEANTLSRYAILAARVGVVVFERAYAEELDSYRRTREAVQTAEDRITACLRGAPRPAAAVVRDVAQQLKIPRGTVKLALLTMIHSGAIRLGETYEITLADR